MASKYVKELRELEATMRDDGWDRRANIIGTAADRMERLEQTVIDAYDTDDAGDVTLLSD